MTFAVQIGLFFRRKLLETLRQPVWIVTGLTSPLSLGPTWLRVLGHLNPMYYAVQAARSLAAGSLATGTVGVGFLVMAAIAALTLWWGTRTYDQAMA